MNGAKRVAFEPGDDPDDDAYGSEELESAGVEPSKTMRPSLHRSNRELRELRDLNWVFLETLGLNLTEIELVCSMANRERSVIGKRVKKAKPYFRKLWDKLKANQADGRL